MRFADRLVSPPARAGAALAALALLVLSVASGASPAKKPPQKIGGVTAVPNRSVFVGTGKGKGQPVYSSDNKDPNSKKEFHPLYAGNTITATGTGVGYFHLHLKSTDLYCSIGVNGPETGTVMVAPPNGDDIDLEHSGVLKCATTATQAKKVIGAPTGVTVRAADPVFTVAATSSKVVVAVRRGAATVVGKDAHKGVVVGVNTDQSKGTAKQVTITGGGNPTQPQTVSGPPDAGLSALANKVPASTDVTPPSTTFAVVPPAVNGQSPFAFEFRSIPAVVSTLFSCSLNGGPFYACSTGNPLPVPPGPDTLSVRATDQAGNTGEPVSTSWYQERSPNAPIVFEADRSPGRYELYQVDPDGKNLKQLTTTSGFDPSWSPNGKQIAYESDKDQAKGSEIYILTLGSTGPPLRLTDNPANDRTPRWSPDGKSIVFASDRNGGVYQLYVMAADRSSGDNPRQLTFLGANHDPSWSTENKIAFVSTRDGKSEIYVMNADGTGRQRPLTKTSQGDNLNPSWSSDGKSIVFESDRDGNEEIYMMNANGTGQQRLTFNPARDSNPVFSPDGKRIAFSSNRAGKSSVDIWVAVLHERNLARITNIGTKDLSPSW